jgi:hypothetical protein
MAKIGDGTGSSIANVLKATGLLGESGTRFMVTLLQEFVLLGIVFASLFIPGPLNLLALALVGFVLPAYKTFQTLARAQVKYPLQSPAATPAADKRASRAVQTPPPSRTWQFITSPLTWLTTPARPKETDEANEQQRLISEQQHWLRYWIVFSVVYLFRLYGFYFPFRTSIIIVLSAYLQHSGLAGATRVLNSLSSLLNVLVSRNKRIQASRFTGGDGGPEVSDIGTGSSGGRVVQRNADNAGENKED